MIEEIFAANCGGVKNIWDMQLQSEEQLIYWEGSR